MCGPDGLQKNSIERSVPKAEGAWSVFGYFLLTKIPNGQLLAGYWFLLLFLVLISKKNLENAGKLTNHFGDLIAAYRFALIRSYRSTS